VAVILGRVAQLGGLCLPKTSSRSTSRRVNNIPVDLLWRVAREDKASNIVTFGRRQPLKNQTEFLVGTGRIGKHSSDFRGMLAENWHNHVFTALRKHDDPDSPIIGTFRSADQSFFQALRGCS